MVLSTPRLMDAFVPRRPPDELDEDRGPLGRVLLRLRGESGLNQTQIADRGGFSQGYYSNVETGVIRNPGKEKMLALDRAFGLAPGTVEARFKEQRKRESTASRSVHTVGRVDYVERDPRGRIVAVLENVPDELAHYILGVIDGYFERKEPDA